MQESFTQSNNPDLNRRSLKRVVPAIPIRAAVENTTRQQILGMAEVVNFSGLGLALSGIAGDPVAALGDNLYVTLIADDGLIPVLATLVYIKKEGLFGLRLQPPPPPAQHYLIRLYQRAAEATAVRQTS